MSDQFEWYIAEEEENEGLMNRPTPNRGPRLPIHPLWLVVIVVILGGFYVGRQILTQNDESADALVTAVQDLLDLQHEAYLKGNGPLFLSAFTNDDAWKTAQLLPYNQEKARAGLRVTHAEQFNTNIRADVVWEANGETWQNVAFFRQQNAQVFHTPPPDDFWGLPQQVSLNWGNLNMHEADWHWQGDIGNFISNVINEVCTDTCPNDQFPLRVVVRDDYRDTPVAGDIYIPSPYLMALDSDGQPAPIFYDLLRQKIEAYLSPAVTIRFGVPPEDDVAFLKYQDAATEFMRLHPRITVELIPLTSDPPDPEQLAELDGAALQLTEALISRGAIYDLTDFALGDANLEPGDFYEQIWAASFWRGRMWQVPQVAEMQVIFYDRMAYQVSDQPEPTLRWTWDEMAQDMTAVLDNDPSEGMIWGYLDITRDTLYSYAYNWKNECTEEATVRCGRHLDVTAVAAALEWYEQMISAEEMPDFTQIPEDELARFILRAQAVQRQALIWADNPVRYEHLLLLDAVGIVSFPGSDRFDGITPLRIRGNIITQQSRQPLATWEWIKFLSHQAPIQHLRFIPARPSVANSAGFWTRLPLPLSNAMRTAFPFARPILIEEQGYFTNEQITAVISGQMTASEAAHEWPHRYWFGVTPEE